MEIIFDNVSFMFADRLILHDFSERISAGEHVGLMGESGAGKSTLLNSVVGLVLPHSGRIIIEGMSVDESSVQQIRSRVAWLPQEVNLPFDMVKDVIDAPFQLKVNRDKRFDRGRMFELFDSVGLGREIYDQQMNSLSGGERQRLMIVSALMLDKRLLLLDEPTSALDATSRQRLSSFFRSLENTTILAVTHDDIFAESCDRVIKIEKLK